MIFLGDINGHHHTWGSLTNNTQGINIAEIVEEHDLVVLNDGSPTYISGNHTTTVDVTFLSSEIGGKIKWKRSDDLSGSDHFPISLLTTNTQPKTTRRPRWKYEEADWFNFTTNIGELFYDHAPGNIEEITQLIRSTAGDCIPRTSAFPQTRATKWWNPTTKKAISTRRSKLRAYLKQKRKIAKISNRPIPEDEMVKLHDLHRAYKEARNQCKQIILAAKRESWTSFLDSINENQPIGELWRRVNAVGGKRRQYSMALLHHGTTTRDPVQVAEILAEYFASLSAFDKYPPAFRNKHQSITTALNNIQIPEDSPTSHINSNFSIAELHFAIMKGQGKSEGNDEVGYPLLKHLPPIGKRVLLNAMNNIWTNHTFPDSWLHSLVIPIPKKEGAASTSSHYRPISLTCCTGKIMERMVNRRLTQWLENNNILDEQQHAFRAGRGTSTYFAELSQILNEAWPENHVEIATLDLAKAYNRAWMPRVIQKLIDWGLSGNLIHYLLNFTQKRTFQVCIGNHRSSIHREEVGVPQGSVIAVTLFLIAMDGVYSKLPTNMFALTYADDIALIVSGPSPKRIRRKVQTAVKRVAEWAEQTGFIIAAPKCELFHACMSRHRILNTPVMCNGIQIPRKNTIRLLGVTLDRTLTFDAHILQTRKNCQSRINLLRSLSKKHSTSNRKTLLRVEEAIVDSRLLYGAELTCLKTDQTISNLAPLHNRAIRTVSGLLPSTPADTACAESGILPFRFKFANTIIRRAISLLERTPENEDTHLVTEAKVLMEQHTNQSLPAVCPAHWTGARGWDLPSIKVDKKFEKSFRKGDNTHHLRATFRQHINNKYFTHTIRYSDGSVKENNVGVGVYGDVHYSLRLNNTCSIFSAEAAGIFYAATTSSSNPILVVSDSKSAISALQSDLNKHPWIQATMKAASNVEFMWVPSHCGIAGNEEADKLANAGREHIHPTVDTIPAHDARKYTKTKIKQSWNLQWHSDNNAFLRNIKNTTEPWTDPNIFTDQRRISRLRTGHTRFTHRMSGSGPFRIKCPVCNVHNTVTHVLLQCPQYEQARIINNIPSNVREALGDDPTATTQVIKFLKDIKLYYEV